MNGRTTAALVVIGVAAVLSFFLHSEPIVDNGATTDLPDGYYLEGVALTGTNAMGEVQYQLQSERIDHHPSDGSIELEQLSIRYGSERAPWILNAERGRMPASGDRIALSGGVKLEGTGIAAGDAPARVLSETLDVDIVGQTASTDAPVRIEAGRGAMTGTGLEVDFANETLRVLSDIAGAFEPPSESTPQ